MKMILVAAFVLALSQAQAAHLSCSDEQQAVRGNLVLSDFYNVVTEKVIDCMEYETQNCGGSPYENSCACIRFGEKSVPFGIKSAQATLRLFGRDLTYSFDLKMRLPEDGTAPTR